LFDEPPPPGVYGRELLDMAIKRLPALRYGRLTGAARARDLVFAKPGAGGLED
jgi:hypothetical protein